MVALDLRAAEGRDTSRGCKCTTGAARAISLRLVEEYRGRRIVSNGKLYGIQGELITDCRYITMESARNAIDSEVALNRRVLPEQLLERVAVVLLQALGELVHVEHVRREALRSHADAKIRWLDVKVEQDESHAEQHAQRLEPILVSLGQRRWHCDVRLCREESVRDSLPEGDNRLRRIVFTSTETISSGNLMRFDARGL